MINFAPLHYYSSITNFNQKLEILKLSKKELIALEALAKIWNERFDFNNLLSKEILTFEKEESYSPLVYTKNRGGYITLICNNCKKIYGIYYYDLITKRKHSCRCYTNNSPSLGAGIVKDCLEEISKMYNIEYGEEWTHKELRYPKTNGILRVDFVIYKKNTRDVLGFIEFDGKQHYEYVPRFHENGYEDFVEQQNRDKFKDNFIEAMGVPLLRIRDLENKSKNIKNIESKIKDFFHTQSKLAETKIKATIVK